MRDQMDTASPNWHVQRSGPASSELIGLCPRTASGGGRLVWSERKEDGSGWDGKEKRKRGAARRKKEKKKIKWEKRAGRARIASPILDGAFSWDVNESFLAAAGRNGIGLCGHAPRPRGDVQQPYRRRGGREEESKKKRKEANKPPGPEMPEMDNKQAPPKIFLPRILTNPSARLGKPRVGTTWGRTTQRTHDEVARGCYGRVLAGASRGEIY